MLIKNLLLVQVLARFATTLRDAKAVRRYLRWQRQDRRDRQAQAAAKEADRASAWVRAAWRLQRHSRAWVMRG